MKGLTGTWALVRLAMRRERIAIPIWALLIISMVAGYGQFYTQFFTTPEQLHAMASEMVRNRSLVAFGGQIWDDSLGAVFSWRMGDTAVCLIALMALLTVFRHTRAEEESGRQELVGAGVVGRYAPLTAALIVTVGACILIGLIIAVALVSIKPGPLGYAYEPVGSFALGMELIGTGMVFAGVAAVAAQVTETNRGAIVLGASVLGLSYALRFMGDGSGVEWMVWLSPNGWASRVQPFGDERWWLLGLMLGVAAVLAATAYRLIARRDLGAGLLPDRAGADSAPDLRTPIGLAWRLQRGMLFGWTFCFALAGLGLGNMATTMPQLAGRSNEVQEFLNRYSGSATASLSDIFLELIFVSLGMTVALYPGLATLRLRAEEVSGRAETVLATTASRTQFVVSHFAIAMLGTVVILAASGLATGLAYGGATGNIGGELPRLLAGQLIYTPAAWTMAGLALFLFGFLPRIAVGVIWGVFMYIQLIGEVFGPMILKEGYQVTNALQPFHHISKISSGGDLNIWPLLIFVVTTLVLALAGAAGFRRRDLTS